MRDNELLQPDSGRENEEKTETYLGRGLDRLSKGLHKDQGKCEEKRVVKGNSQISNVAIGCMVLPFSDIGNTVRGAGLKTEGV